MTNDLPGRPDLGQMWIIQSLVTDAPITGGKPVMRWLISAQDWTLIREHRDNGPDPITGSRTNPDGSTTDLMFRIPVQIKSEGPPELVVVADRRIQ